MTTSRKDLTRPAAFLDRDGTLVEERNFLGDPKAVKLIPGAVEAIRLLNLWGYWVIGVSNQSGVARGYFGMREVEAVNEKIISDLAVQHAYLNRIYNCPHHPDVQRQRGEEPCRCRKPAPGMIERAIAEYPIDLTQSFVVGDQCADVGLGRSVGVSTVLVRTGFGRFEESHLGPSARPDAVVDDVLEAVRWFGRSRGLVLELPN